MKKWGLVVMGVGGLVLLGMFALDLIPWFMSFLLLSVIFFPVTVFLILTKRFSKVLWIWIILWMIATILLGRQFKPIGSGIAL